MRKTWIILAALAAIPAAGCLVGERSHTLYLEPDGSVTWTATERDIR